MTNVEDAREITAEPPPAGGPYPEFGNRALDSLLRLHWFTTFFCWLADRQYPASHRPETRVFRLRTRNPRFYWLCVGLDLVVGVAAVGLVIATVAVALYKTVVL